jgi:uncharacterized protein (TIGR03083 family)
MDIVSREPELPEGGFPRCSLSGYVAALRDAGQRLARAATSAGLDAVVPPCEGWRTRDLLAHIGGVHRWAASYVRTGRSGPTTDEEDATYFAAPADEALIAWFEDGHVALLEALATADPSVSCWTFLPAPSPLAFWARRQAHETAIHSADAEAAAGWSSSFPPELAADGIDELLSGLLSRPRGRLVSDPPVTLGIRAADTGDAWTVRVEAERRLVTRSASDAACDCLLDGPASDLYLLLWNRQPSEPGPTVQLNGDPAVLELWRDRATIRWS